MSRSTDSRDGNAAVTDNASNFVKTFKTFGIEFFDESDSFENIDRNDSDNVEFISQPEETSDALKLPNHTRCTSHTLSLVAPTDSKKALKSVPFSKINHTTMDKGLGKN